MSALHVLVVSILIVLGAAEGTVRLFNFAHRIFKTKGKKLLIKPVNNDVI